MALTNGNGTMTQGFDIDELERLLAAATPGEWQHDPSVSFADAPELPCVIDASRLIIAQVFDDGRSLADAERNAALIVAAHNSLPAMIAEIRELRAENARFLEALDEDGLAEIITDTIDMDWQPRWATQAIRRAALGEPK